MVKLILFAFVLSLFCSCYKVQYNEYHVPARIIDNKKLNTPDSIYKALDTLALYQLIKYKTIGDFFIPKEDSFIRFYSKGKLISYASRIALSKEYFRPARGLQGTYFVKKKKTYCTFYNGGGVAGGGGAGVMNFKKDTLIILVKNVEYYYLKVKNVDPDWIDWQPDW